MRGSGSIAGASAYGTTSRTPRTYSRPTPSRASPSNVIDVDAINDNVGANPPARTTSTGRCLSVASAPTRPSRPLDPFEPPNCSQSAYAGSSKGKGGLSKGGKGGVFPRGEFAGIAPSGRPVISGGATGLEVLENSVSCTGPRPRSMQNTFESGAQALTGSILMKILLATRATTTDLPSSVQHRDGSTVLGHRGRTAGHQGHPGTNRVPESRKSKTTGSTNLGTRMPRKHKLLLE